MESLLEKMILDLIPLRGVLERRGDIMFAVNTCLEYFLREELEFPPPTKPPTIVLTMNFGSFLDTSERKW